MVSYAIIKALLPFYSIIILTMEKSNNYLNGMCQMTWYQTLTDYWKQFVENEQEWFEKIKSFIEEERGKLTKLDLTKEENYMKITEFVMMMNWRSWYLDDNGMQGEVEWMYIELREKYNDWCYDNLKDSAMKYYFRTTD